MSKSTIITANLLAILYLLIILLACLNRVKLDKAKKPVIRLCVYMIGFLLCDCIFVFYSHTSEPWKLTVLFISKSIYLIFNSAIAHAYRQFVNALIWDNVYTYKWQFVVANVMLASNIAIVIVNFVKPILFVISAQGEFVVQTTGMIIFTVLNYAVVFAVIISILQNSKNMRQDFVVPVIAFPMLPVIVEVLQIFIHEIDLLCLYSLSMLLMFYVLINSNVFVDELTGLYNRVKLNETLKVWFNTKKPCYICGILFDVDGMSSINEKYGHEAGDKMLMRTARIVLALSKKDVLPFRYGGDEFLLLWKDDDDSLVDKMKMELEYSQKKMNNSLQLHEQIHFSSGIYSCDNQKCTIDEFLQAIDSRLYSRKTEIDTIVERAIKEDNFEVYYQPVYCLRDKNFAHAEALCKLNDPDYGYVATETFIAAAEKNNTVSIIDSMVLEKVCEFIASEEFEKTSLIDISVNVSSIHCMNLDFVDEFIKIVDKYGIEHNKIVLEITETAASSLNETFIKNFQGIVDAGFKVALDDFGAGYANMGRLISLPFDTVKLDKVLLDSYKDPKTSLLISTFVKTIQDLKMQIVAEGVESEEQVEYLKKLNILFIQGYYYSRPLSKDRLIEMLR